MTTKRARVSAFKRDCRRLMLWDDANQTMRHALAVILILDLGLGLQASEHKEKHGIQWAPFVEWTIENPSFEDNPFDLEAMVRFEHEDTKTTIITPMFYAGENRWRFRFCGTIPGPWDWTSISQDDDLNGHQGSVLIEPNDHGHGFVVPQGNKWARQKGRNGKPEAFIPQYVMYRNPAGIAQHKDLIDQDVDTFIHQHGFTGFHVPVYCRWFDLDQERSNNIEDTDPNPDIATFEVLEMFIQKVHSAGGVVHFWAWGDESRRQTPVK